MNNQPISKDPRELLRAFYLTSVSSNHEGIISEALAFYDWCLKIEKDYRKSKSFSEKILISDQALYEFVTKK